MYIIFVSSGTEQANPGHSDGVQAYGQRVLEVGMLFKGLVMLCKLPDRSTYLSLSKLLLQVLYAHSQKGKYTLEILRFLVRQNLVMSPCEAHETFHGLFVNTRGTIDSYIPCDLQMDVIVKEQKRLLKHMFAGKTPQNIDRKSSALSGTTDVAANYDATTGVIVRSTRRAHVSSVSDEKLIISDLRTIKPYIYNEGRLVVGLRTIVSKSGLCSLPYSNYLKWLKWKNRYYVTEAGQ